MTSIAGAENHLLDLLPGLIKQDIECHLICITPNKDITTMQQYCDQMNMKGVKTTLLQAGSIFSFFPLSIKVKRYLKLHKIDYIHSHLFNSDFIASLTKFIRSKKLIHFSTKHGYEETYLVRYGLGNKQINFNFYYLVTWLVNKRIDYNLAVSSAIAKMYAILKLDDQMKFVQHGISYKATSNKQLKLSGNPSIMTAGRLSEIKGHKFLLDAMPVIIGRFPEVKLYILGVGELKATLQKQAEILNLQQHVEFVGYKNVADYSSHCKLMVLPSLFESFGLVFIESFASKIPVVAFDTGAGNEIIENNETGLLATVGDSADLAQKIIYLLNSPDERNRLVDNAYAKYNNYYSAERMVQDTAQWYRTVLASC